MTNPDDIVCGSSNLNGLTKRELFAAMAMQGLMASEINPNAFSLSFSNAADRSVKQADALIEALNKK